MDVPRAVPKMTSMCAPCPLQPRACAVALPQPSPHSGPVVCRGDEMRTWGGRGCLSFAYNKRKRREAGQHAKNTASHNTTAALTTTHRPLELLKAPKSLPSLPRASHPKRSARGPFKGVRRGDDRTREEAERETETHRHLHLATIGAFQGRVGIRGEGAGRANKTQNDRPPQHVPAKTLATV